MYIEVIAVRLQKFIGKHSETQEVVCDPETGPRASDLVWVYTGPEWFRHISLDTPPWMTNDEYFSNLDQ